MKELLFCMTLCYLKNRFYKYLNNDELDMSGKYLQCSSDILFFRWVINSHKIEQS